MTDSTHGSIVSKVGWENGLEQGLEIVSFNPSCDFKQTVQSF